MHLTVNIIGATGLVGTALVNLLLADVRVDKVRLFVRRPSGFNSGKIEEHLVDFDHFEQWKALVKGDVLFSALGTTLKTAGSKQAQYRIDYTYQYNFAKAAADNKVPSYVLVSAAMASPDSKMFYSRMKGELEAAVKKLPFQSIAIFQPGVLTGDRKEKRTGEIWSEKLLNGLNRLGLFKKYKPIPAATVAKAMLHAATDPQKGTHTYTLLDVFRMAGDQRV